MQRLLFEKDPAFWYETLRSLGHIAYGGADFGEVVTTAGRIVSGDYDSWHDEWLLTADRVATRAHRSLAGGHRVSARDGYLRASNYYRNAEFFLHADPDDPRVEAAYRASVGSFRQAARLLDVEVSPVRIPYEATALPGYFYRAGPGLRPTVLVHNGFDGSAEEMHFVAAAALVERGYHVLSFDGPGQPGARHDHGLVFRPDWEHVVTPVLDFALSRSGVDGSRIALLGNSMGGLLAPRAAAFEQRIAALVALDGVTDMGALVLEQGHSRTEVQHALRNNPVVAGQLAAQAERNPTVRWALGHGPWATGTPSPAEFAARLLDFRLADGVAEQIGCPTLVCSGASDRLFSGQPETLYQRLTCRKTFLEFTDELGAGEHCQAGAARLTMSAVSDWLDHTLSWGGNHV
ncbi:alpha/beta fold hydrolase [Amycolatopsis ultiminotia]|uniref:Alpha/beta fold hydrolase n=1 Tax=Amycolatopsis ultiminotia TaxID=543629 RepID=A0ABP6W716_9PSEU